MITCVVGGEIEVHSGERKGTKYKMKCVFSSDVVQVLQPTMDLKPPAVGHVATAGDMLVATVNLRASHPRRDHATNTNRCKDEDGTILTQTFNLDCLLGLVVFDLTTQRSFTPIERPSWILGCLQNGTFSMFRIKVIKRNFYTEAKRLFFYETCMTVEAVSLKRGLVRHKYQETM